MAKNYLEDKAEKKKIGLQALWILLIVVGLAVVLVVKITLTGSLKAGIFSGLPSSDEAYTIAKEYVRPTIKSSSADFSDSRYQFGKTSDSLYVIKSTVTSRDKNDEKVDINFKIILKYNGGEPSRQKNWSLITLDEY